MKSKLYEVKLADGNISHTLSKWKHDMIKSMMQIRPDYDIEKVSKIVDRELKKRYRDLYVTCDNNYKHETKGQGLLKVLDWAHDYKPIIAGNGTFYENQDNAINPTGQMVSMLLDERAALKAEMFKLDDPNSYEYKDLDNKQGNKKRSANSAYGASGAPTSDMYSKWSAPATTLTAQSVISTCESTIEAFLGSNHQFINLNECINWMNYICHFSKSIEIDQWVMERPYEMVIDKIKNMFLDYDKTYDEIIDKYIYNRSPKELVLLYYKDNLYEFIKDHQYVIELYRNVFKNIDTKDDASSIDEVPSSFISECKDMIEKDIIKSYNRKIEVDNFLNPNKIPNTISSYMKELMYIFKKYVYTDILIPDKILRLKRFNRNSVVIVDTDSCIIQMDTITDFLKEWVMESNYGRSEEQNEFIAVNSMAAILSDLMVDILYKYTGWTNISENFRRLFVMKNEFLFIRLIIGTKKKRYMSLIKLREGNLLKKPKADCKGNDYMKSGTSVATFKVFDDIVKNDMLKVKSIDVSHIRQRLSDFSKDIYTSLQEGNTEFLPLLKINEFNAYKDPYRQQQVRGAVVWNEIYPDKPLEFPVSASALKLLISKPEDVSDLRFTNPNIYEKLLDLFNHDICKKVSKSGKVENRGLGVIMIPQGEKIPDWCKPYIDYETIINAIIGKFKSVTNMLKIKNISVGKKIGNSDRKSQKLSNIVGF